MNPQKTTSSSRRTFLGGAAALAAASVIPASKAFAVSPALTYSDIPGTGDVKVVNYALALEQLEADFYHQCVLRLTTGGTNYLGTTIPGLNLDPSTHEDVRYMIRFGEVERLHRNLLTSVLGNKAIGAFKYQFGIESKSRQQIIQMAADVEATGVSAYLGAIPFFSSGSQYLPVAGAIQGTEARHTAQLFALLNQIFDVPLNVAPKPYQNHGADSPLGPNQVLAAVSQYIVTT